MFEKVLIANRGEIALRIHRACQEMGIKTVAAHSEADANAMHVKLADEAVCIGPANAQLSYFNKAAIISAALLTGADAIHPGYGFLSENADFAEMVTAHGLVFIGPRAEMIRQLGDKIKARELAEQAGLPLVPGSPELKTVEMARSCAEKIGFPVIFKASAGGGGKGMHIARNMEELDIAYMRAKQEAKTTFQNDSIYLEKYLQNPRHIEVQIMADNHGNVVHLGERDCSLQRAHQKIIEETPCPALNPIEREYICSLAVNSMRKIGYNNFGTIEFLYENGHFYFLEVNTRLQVEHPVTEMITGIDLVREQIRLASGAKLDYRQEDIQFNGAAIECRINAEDPYTFIPCPGKIGVWHVPGGLDVRVDSGMYASYVVPPNYDSLVAKLIVHGKNRNAVLMRLKRALNEFVIEGIKTTIPLHQQIITAPEFIDGQYNIHWLEKFIAAREELHQEEQHGGMI